MSETLSIASLRTTHDQIVAHEKQLYDACVAARGNPFEVLAADRARRWKPLIPLIERPAAVDQWAARMAELHGPLVKIHGNVVDWVTALVIVRYGEAEYFWPDALSSGDVSRALEWQLGKVPEGVRHLA